MRGGAKPTPGSFVVVDSACARGRRPSMWLGCRAELPLACDRRPPKRYGLPVTLRCSGHEAPPRQLPCRWPGQTSTDSRATWCLVRSAVRSNLTIGPRIGFGRSFLTEFGPKGSVRNFLTGVGTPYSQSGGRPSAAVFHCFQSSTTSGDACRRTCAGARLLVLLCHESPRRHLP